MSAKQRCGKTEVNKLKGKLYYTMLYYYNKSGLKLPVCAWQAWQSGCLSACSILSTIARQPDAAKDCCHFALAGVRKLIIPVSTSESACPRFPSLQAIIFKIRAKEIKFHAQGWAWRCGWRQRLQLVPRRASGRCWRPGQRLCNNGLTCSMYHVFCVSEYIFFDQNSLFSLD